MHITYDKDADAMYIEFCKGALGSNLEVLEGVILDLGPEGKLLGIGILEASQRCPLEEVGDLDVGIPSIVEVRL